MKKNGFSLVELLIVLALFSILTAALATVFVSQTQTYTIQSDIGEVHQTGKAMLDFISKELRATGAGLIDKNYYLSASKNVMAPISSTNNVGGSDGIQIRGNFLGIYGTISSVSAGTNIATIKYNPDSRGTFLPGHYITVSDRGNSEMRTITNVSGNEITVNSPWQYAHSGSVPFNCVQNFKYTVSNETLYKDMFDGNGIQPLLDGVEQFQIKYGVDSNNDDYVDSWVDEVTGDMRNVRSIKVYLIIRGRAPDPNITDIKTYDLGTNKDNVKTTYTPVLAIQHYRRILFETNVELRNRYFGS